ncbi:MAG TPA: hypothetical protein VKN99_05295 [Polyangia bacterium]|nr:hypothetical protein [Polyangia bacterium]
MAEPGTQTVDPQAGVREANAVLNRVLARLGELAEPDIDRAGAGQALVAAIRALYDALAPTASEGKRADAVTDAMRQLSAGLALLQERPLQSTEATLVLHETARALALLFPVQKQLQEVALANFQNRKAMRMDPAGRVGTGAGVLYQWSRAKLLLHAIDRLTVGPTFAPAPQAPPPEPEEPDDAPPGFTMEELKAMAAAIQQGGPLPGSEPEPEAEEAPSEPPAPLTLPVPEQPLPDDLLATHLAVLATLYEQRRFEQGDPGTPWIRLAATEQRIYERVDAVAWLGDDVVARLAEALEGVDGAPAGFAAALPLCAISGVDAVDAVFRALEALPEAAHPGVLEALRLSPHPEVSARLVGLLRVEAPGSVRAGAVTIAAERGLLQEHAVTALLADPDPAVVAAAATAALRTGKRHLVPKLEELSQWAQMEPAASALLTAAAVLGGARARERMRRRVADEPEPPVRLVEVLAACGDERDVAALAQVARAGGEAAPVAIRTLGWLGASAALEMLILLVRDPELGEHALPALERLTGSPDPARAQVASGRRYRGAPWTTAVPLAVLADPGASAPDRDLAFLDLVARTGLHVPFDPSWPIERQRGAISGWRSELEPRLKRFATGGWLYGGNTPPSRKG